MEPRMRLLLVVVSASIFVMVLIGGATRLSKAGLAIVEWRLITGIIPPLSQSQWEREFEKYKKIAQYELVHKDISLDGFKKIYLIEYFHRLAGRLVGISIFGAFLYVLIAGARFWKIYWGVLSVLVFIQGVIGWLMVRTGVAEPRPFVSPIFLAFHNMFALFVFAYALWGIYKADCGEWFRVINIISLKRVLVVGIFVFLVQVFLGTLMAGQKAALISPTWPDFNGKIVPGGLFASPLDNPVFSNFSHRYLPFVLLIIFILALRIRRSVGVVLISLWVLQFVSGVLTLINSRGDIPLVLGVLHQGGAWIIFSFLFMSFLRTQGSSAER